MGRPSANTAGGQCLVDVLHTLGFPTESLGQGMWLYARVGLRSQESETVRCVSGSIVSYEASRT
jgi:hypothetical protein